LVDRSKGKIRADVAHEKITAMGYAGSERTTRRAVAQLKAAWQAGRRRVHRPWVAEPGMWAQYDFGDGPRVGAAATVLFCFWLAWSRFRVVIPLLDKSQPSVFAAIDVALRRAGGAPAYLLTDNEKTVTVEHVVGLPVRNAGTVAFARHYGLTVATCVPCDPASKGGSESTVKIAKADLVPAEASWRLHRRPGDSLEDLAEAVNPIVRGWMTYWGRFYRTEMDPLLKRINTYLMRWARKKYKRLRGFKRLKAWWKGVTLRDSGLFAHWAWTRKFHPAGW
jgi:hypothetical protein